MPGFGLAHLRGEGEPLHPDDMECDLSEEQYDMQLKAYNAAYQGRVELSDDIES
jgi:hypothetical protein